MAVVDGVIRGVTVLGDSKSWGMRSAERTFFVSVDFPAFTSGADTGRVAGIPAALALIARSGKTLTLRSGMCVVPAASNANADVFAGAMTVSTNDLTFSLTTVDRSTAAATFTTALGFGFVCNVTES